MKKFFTTFFLASMLLVSIHAQEKRHEIYAGCGVLNTSTFVSAFSDVISSALTAGMYSSNEKFSPTFHAGYKYLPSKHIAIGLTYAYTHGTADAYLDKELSGHFKNNYHTLAAEFDYRYISTEKFKLYSTAGVGATFFTQKYEPSSGDSDQSNLVNVDFQISPIGIKYGNSFGVFAEVGFGYKGIVCAGLFARF